jgi:hypothetical protein
MRLTLVFIVWLFAVAAVSAAETDVAGLIVTKGDRDIAEVRLTGASPRYVHGVFGARVEPTGIEVIARGGRRITFGLGEGAVFEDREVRLADLDGDGRDEMIVVQTDLKRGASLAVYGLEGGRIVLRAETPPLGAARRWLNPAGIGNFKGDGLLIALVRQPHAVGELQLWRYTDRALKREAVAGDTANHKFGSLQRHLAAVVDWNGDGKSDLAIADFGRRAVRVIGFGGEPHDLARIEVPGEISGNFRITGSATAPEIEVGLADGKSVRIGKGGVIR